MKKQKLTLNNLKVSSFATDKVEGNKGGNQYTRFNYGTCQWYCGGSGGIGGSYNADCFAC